MGSRLGGNAREKPARIQRNHLFMVSVSSWFYFILFNQQEIVLPFCLRDKGKPAPDFFPFIPENDLLMSSSGEKVTLLSVKNSHSLRSWRY